MRRVLLAVVAVAVLLLAGCGIPDDSRVMEIGPGPTAGPPLGDDGTPPPEVTREATTDPATFVGNFLQAAAGDPEGAINRVKKFLTPSARAAFKPTTPGVQVVRLVEQPLVTPGNNVVTLTVQQVGQLQNNGVLGPSENPTPYPLTLALETDQDGLYVAKPPSALLLSDTGLNNFYQRRTIYFWNNEYTGLVPDVRYMPLSTPTVQQPTAILNWLAGGPADWLKNAVQSLPQGTTAPDNVPASSDGRLQVSLSDKAAPPGDAKMMDRLRRQLQWSLGALIPRTLELKVGHQNPVSYSDTSYLESNPAYRLVDTPERFVVYNGVIRRLAESPRAVSAVPVLKREANKNVESAALSTSATHNFAAVVTSSGAGEVLRVAAAPTGADADLQVVKGLTGSLGHPVWTVAMTSDPGDAIGLITANGRLHSFGVDGAAAQPIEWQGGDPGPISAVSIAPDGVRVALVSRGRLFRAVLTTSGDGVAMATPEQIVAPTLRSVGAVAWSGESWLVVAGARASDGRITVRDVTVDGADFFMRLPDIGTEAVTYLTAYPANPVGRTERSGLESYVARDAAWDVLTAPFQITVGQLAGPAGSPAPGDNPTAPFFLD